MGSGLRTLMLACEVLGVWLALAALGHCLKDGPRVPSSCSPRNGLIQDDEGSGVERPCAGLCLSVSVSVFQTLSLRFSMCDILCLCVYNSVHLSRCLSPSISVSIFVCLYFGLYLYVSVSLTLYLCLSLSDFVSVSLSLSDSVSL